MILGIGPFWVRGLVCDTDPALVACPLASARNGQDPSQLSVPSLGNDHVANAGTEGLCGSKVDVSICSSNKQSYEVYKYVTLLRETFVIKSS